MIDAKIKTNLLRVVLVDSSILLLMLFLPAISHLMAFPLYKFEPMRIMVLLGFLLSANKKNAYLLALMLPLFSFAVSGHPVMAKAILMMCELGINVLFFSIMMNKRVNTFIAMFLSIVLSKLVYYFIKFLLISVGVLNTNLVDTNIGVQIGITCGIAVTFALLYNYFFKEQR